MDLRDFIRGYRISMECQPQLMPDPVPGLYYHICTLYMYEDRRRHLTVPYITTRPKSTRIVSRRRGQTEYSNISVREILYMLGLESAIFEMARREFVFDMFRTELVCETCGTPQAKASQCKCRRKLWVPKAIPADIYTRDEDLWADMTYGDEKPPREVYDLAYQNAARQAEALHVFLEGYERAKNPPLGHPTIYNALLFEVREIRNALNRLFG